MPSRFFQIAALGALVCFGSSSQAALLVYEGFTGYTTGANLSTVAPNANTIGLNQAVAYSGNGASNYTLQASSLSLGASFPTSGGSIRTGTGTAVAAAQMSLASSYTGTLYSSYLVRLESQGGANGNGALTRIASDNSTTNAHFQSYADSRANSASTRVTTDYDSTTPTEATTSLSLNTTYVLISRFTRVGLGATGATPNVSTIYALNTAQFNSFLAAGATESYLDGTGIGTAANQIWARQADSITTGTFTFANNLYAHFVSVGDTTNFDELRFGSTLMDVIPEPSTAFLLLGGLAVFTLRRRVR